MNLQGAYLTGAALQRANLLGANLRDANLRRANLYGANLQDADLICADLQDADLQGADLLYADLRSANLQDAILQGADLRGANLQRAKLQGAILYGADIRNTCWDDVKKDMFEKMALMPNEVPFLYKSIHDGKIDGSCYEGDCCCFVGTMAHAVNKPYKEIPIKNDSDSPVERFFMGIRQGDTPKNNPLSQLASEWIEELCKEKEIALNS